MQRLSYIAHFQIARSKSTNPGQISSKAISGRDTGKRLQIRDCPGHFGTVGTYI